MTTATYQELNLKLISLNANIAELDKQRLEQLSQKEEVEAQIQERKKYLIDTYISQCNQIIMLMNQRLETQQELMDMGFDPTNVEMGEIDSVVEKTLEEAMDSFMEGEHVKSELSETSVDIEESKVAKEVVMEEMEDCSEDTAEVSLLSSKKSKSQLLKPFFYVWGLRKGEFKKNCSMLEWKQTAPRLQTSWLKLTKAPVNRTMNMGNTMYRPTYATPNEGRVYSAYGTAPTLTSTHSDITVRIGTDPRSIETTLTAA